MCPGARVLLTGGALPSSCMRIILTVSPRRRVPYFGLPALRMGTLGRWVKKLFPQSVFFSVHLKLLESAGKCGPYLLAAGLSGFGWSLGCDSAGASWHPLQPCWSGHLSGSFGLCAPAWVTCAEWLPAGLHGSEGAAVSGEILVEACWPRKRPMADPFDVLSFLDAPDCCDSAFVVYGADLGKCVGAVTGQRRCRECIACLTWCLLAALVVGLRICWLNLLRIRLDCGQEGWLRPGLQPLRALPSAWQHPRAAISDA